MKIKVLTLILVSSLAGCTVQREFTVTPIKSAPKTSSSKKTVKKYVATVSNGKVRAPAQVEVYDVGLTVDDDGNLVGKHQLYRVVETSRWVFGNQVKTTGKPTPIKPKIDEVKEATESAKQAAAEARSAAQELRTVMAQKDTGPQQIGNNNVGPAPVDDALKAQIDSGFSPNSGTQALQDWSKAQDSKP